MRQISKVSEMGAMPEQQKPQGPESEKQAEKIEKARKMAGSIGLGAMLAGLGGDATARSLAGAASAALAGDVKKPEQADPDKDISAMEAFGFEISSALPDKDGNIPYTKYTYADRKGRVKRTEARFAADGKVVTHKYKYDLAGNEVLNDRYVNGELDCHFESEYEAGKLVARNVIDKDGKLLRNSKYDDRGNEVEVTHYWVDNKNKPHQDRTTTTYNDNKKPVVKNFYEDEKLSFTVEYAYDADNNLTTETFKNPKGKVETVNKYNEDGSYVSRDANGDKRYYDENGNMTKWVWNDGSTTTYTYNDKGQETKRVSNDTYSVQTVNNYYNKKGQLVKEIWHNHQKGEPKSSDVTIVTTYQYNSKNGIVNQKEKIM